MAWLFICGMRGIRAAREDTHALRLKSKLFDLRSGYANPILRTKARRGGFESTHAEP